MKVEFVSIKNAVLDWIDDNDFGHDEVNEPLLIKWAGDVVRWCASQDQLKPRIGVFQVQDTRAKLPDDFEKLLHAAACVDYGDPCECDQVADPNCCAKKSIPQNGRIPKTRKEDLVQWVQGTLEKDCELEINLNCPRCHTTSCDCNTPWVEVDVDRIWEMANPQIYYGNFTRIGKFGNGPGLNSPYASVYNPKFHLMRYASNDYHRLRQVVGNCPNVNCDNCRNEFILDRPYLEVDFDKGEVLVAYLGKTLDGDGELMIPDDPDIHEAILNHLDYKWYRLQWKKEADTKARAVSAEAMSIRDKHMAIAKDRLDIPEFYEFKAYLDGSSFLKRIPIWQSDYAGKPVPDLARRYGKTFDKGGFRH